MKKRIGLLALALTLALGGGAALAQNTIAGSADSGQNQSGFLGAAPGGPADHPVPDDVPPPNFDEAPGAEVSYVPEASVE